MKDIDRNINSILSRKINSLEFGAFNIDFSKYKSVYSKRIDINLDDTANTTSTSSPNLKLAYPGQVALEAGDYYLHTLQPVSSDNTQCLFTLSTKDGVSRPFFSYYAQSPVDDTNNEIYYGHNFTLLEDRVITISRNSPISASFKMKSVIRIYKKEG
nr:MAG TPA: hypothetical protein [Caudoviricetes sp.]